VLEVGINVALFGKRRQALGEPGKLLRLVTTRLPKSIAGVGAGGMKFGGFELFGCGNAERGVVRGEDGIGLGMEPANVAELEGHGRSGFEGAQVEKVFKPLWRGLEVGRELEQE
jgi:hypothetical protein